MIISRPRKSDAVLVWIGVTIFFLLVLGIFFVVRRQPQIPPQAPNAPGAAAYMGTDGVSAGGEAALARLSAFGQFNPAFAQTWSTNTPQVISIQ